MAVLVKVVWRKLNKLARKASICYILGCGMHCRNRPFQVAFTTAFGEGGIGMNTMLQCLHTCWSVQDALGQEFKTAWNMFLSLDGDDIVDIDQITKSLLTRWGYVLQCAEQILENWDDWQAFLKHVYELVDTKEKGMSKQTIQLMMDPKLKCELLFVIASGNCYWKKHSLWLHRVDKKNKLAGFSSHKMILRIAIMGKEFVEVCNNWQEMPEFADYVSALDALPSDIKDEAGTKTRAGKETTNDQMKQFFKEYFEVAMKNFAIWKKNGLKFALASSNFEVFNGICHLVS